MICSDEIIKRRQEDFFDDGGGGGDGDDDDSAVCNIGVLSFFFFVLDFVQA